MLLIIGGDGGIVILLPPPGIKKATVLFPSLRPYHQVWLLSPDQQRWLESSEGKLQPA